MPSIDFKIYLIGDRTQTSGRPLSQVIREAGRAGIRAIQFREKDLPLRAQLQLASEIRSVAKQQRMQFFVNDRIDLCLALDAEGIHLPSSGLPVAVAREMLGGSKRIGVSCHSLEEVQRAEFEGADFAVLGPIYETPSKRPYGPPLGIDLFRKVRRSTAIPLFAIGGVDRLRLKELFEAGADGVAMISAILSSSDVYQASQALIEEMDRLHWI
ncbi:MAG: thiamine phosphate synthase [Nitrospirae bacterium]|nr:thiamine phosphate synthase [Candidatus Manganitrophaceae bacterium]